MAGRSGFGGSPGWWCSTSAPSTAGWAYRRPLDDALRVRDHVSFWNERTDIGVDGELQRRPVTPWSPPAQQGSADAEWLEFG